MASPTKSKNTLVANRSASLHVIVPSPEPTLAPVGNSMTRHSSNELIGTPKSRNTGTFSPVYPRYEVNSDMLAATRRSMELKTSPKMQHSQRSLPPLPSLPSLASKLNASSAPLPSHLTALASSSSASPILTHTPSPAPSSPVIPPTLLSKSEIGQESPLSPNSARRRLPAPPVPPKRPSRATTSPNLSKDTTPTDTPEDDSKKDPKYYSNPEPAVTIKDGLCQRHLSSPSVFENQRIPNAQSVENLESSSVASSDAEISSSNLRASGELTRETSQDSLNSSAQYRSWYLKKTSVQERASPTPKPRLDHRIHRKELPEMVDITTKNKVIKEIFVTEASYVDDLSVTIKLFKEQIQRFQKVSEEDMTVMFSNIEDLYEINKALLSSMIAIVPEINERAADDDPCPPIGDVFLRHLNNFSGYTTYLCNHELSTRVVKKMENLGTFTSFMTEIKKECQGLGLADYLIKPVQRLCKYPLLFKELRKYVQENDPQLPLLNQVIAEIEKLAEVTNRTITNTEKLGEVRRIMGNEIAPLLEGATMVRDGTIYVVVKSKKEESFFWLLDTLIAWHPSKATLRKVVKTSKSSKCKNALSISAITSVCEDEHEHHKHSFSLKFTNHKGKEKQLVFCAQSYLEKLCWIEDIKALVTK